MFWATWCGPCKASIPEVLTFAAETGTEVLAISSEPRDTVERFLAGFSAPFSENVLVDPQKRVSNSYGVQAFPTFVLLDGSGAERARSVGYTTARGLGSIHPRSVAP
jgi:thiol-disulfide isomerase/thioredoxin